MNSNLIDIKFRITNPIDISQCLAEVIKRDYFQAASIFSSDLNEIGQLRQKVESLKDHEVKSEDESTLIRYYATLDTLEKKFPDDQIEFQWYGTLGYSPIGPYGLRSIVYEQLNVLYQLGSLLSQLGISQSRHTDEGLKKSCLYFQQAAGCFQLLNDQVLNNTGKLTNNGAIRLPEDFLQSTLEFCQYLMLAQAQEAIWQKAIGNPDLKNSVISKLSYQTSEYYSVAMKKGIESSTIKQDWINHTTVKYNHFKAASHLRTSYICQEAFKYGEQVAHLKAASNYCATGMKYQRYVAEFVVEDLQGLQETVTTLLRTAEKDNDLIYLKVVPAEKDLSPHQGASMVKSLVPDLNQPVKIFEELIPYVIIQICQAFRERQDSYVKDQLIFPIQALSKMINTFITERGLPASIDSIQKPDGLPESIIQHSREILNHGGLETIDHELSEMNRLGIICIQILQGCQERLKKDADEDNILRSEKGERWNRKPSQVAAAPLVGRIKTMGDYLSQAKTGDQVILQEYEEIKELLKIYCLGYDELIKYIPSTNFIEMNQEVNLIILQLRDCLGAMDISFETRSQFIQGLELKARDNNILPIILESYKKDRSNFTNLEGYIDPKLFEPFYEKHLKMFEVDFKYLQDEKSKQKTLEDKIHVLNEKFKLAIEYHQIKSQADRQTILQSLERAYTKYLQLLSDLNEGTHFYSELIKNGNNLLRECDEYINQRRIEGRQLEEKLSYSLDYTEGQDTNQLNGLRDEVSGTWDPSMGVKFN